jgi:hypothetical protein
VFAVSVIILTLMLVNDVKSYNAQMDNDKKINPFITEYVRAANIIYSGIFGASLIIIVFSTPAVLKLNKYSKFSISSTGLHKPNK